MSTLQRTSSQDTNIDSLPDHILREIFSSLTFSSDKSRLCAPETVSHVSKYWRAVALDFSLLWTFIVVPFPVVSSQIDRAKAGLRRSGDQPIDVHIDVRDPDWDWESEEDQHPMGPAIIVEIMQLLGLSHPRWRSLTVLTDTWEPMHTFLAYSTMFPSFPSLEELSLNRCNAFAGLPDAPDPVPSDPVGLFGGNATLPRLRHVSLAGTHVDYSCTGFKDLQSLDIRHQAPKVSPTIRQLRQLLHGCPGLKSLSLVALNPPDGDDQDDGLAVSLPNLTDLTLGWWFVDDAVKLLNALQLPVVQNLVLEDIAPTLFQNGHVPHDSTAILEALVKMGNRPYNPAAPSSFPSHLRKLTINGLLLDPATFSQFIPFLENLEELELRSVQPELVQAMGHCKGNAAAYGGGPLVTSAILRVR